MCASKCEFIKLTNDISKQIANKFRDLDQISREYAAEICDFNDRKHKEMKQFMAERITDYLNIFKFQQAHRQHLLRHYDENVSVDLEFV